MAVAAKLVGGGKVVFVAVDVAYPDSFSLVNALTRYV